jgi:hypothetical protein
MHAPMAESIRIPTREDGPFHNLKPEYAKHTLDAALGSGLVTDEDARLIEEYVAELRATRGIGGLILLSLMSYRLYALALLAPHLDIAMYGRLKESNPQRRRRMSKNIESLLDEATHLVEENMTDMDRLEMCMAETNSDENRELPVGYN